MIIADYRRPQNIIEYYRRVREDKKEKLDNILRQSEIFVCSLKGSKIQKSIPVNKYRCQKELQNTD